MRFIRFLLLLGLLCFAGIASAETPAFDQQPDNSGTALIEALRTVASFSPPSESFTPPTEVKKPSTPLDEIPVPNLNPADGKKLFDILWWLLKLKGWSWTDILRLYDTNGDGIISGEELRDLLQALIPCGGWFQMSCEERDRLIAQVLKFYLCGDVPDCDPLKKKLTSEGLESLIDRWIASYEDLLSRTNCDNVPPANRATCEAFKQSLRDAIQALKDLKKLLFPTPRPTPTAKTVPEVAGSF